MPTATAAPVPDRASTQRERLRCRVRLADGRVFAGDLAPERHRALQLGDAARADRPGWSRSQREHGATGGCTITTRRRADHFLAGGAGRSGGLARGNCSRSPARHADARRGGVPRPGRAGRSRAATSTRSARPASCGSTSTGPDGLHRAVGVPRRAAVPSARREQRRSGARVLAARRPLPATRVIESTGELVEPIERAHLRLIHHLGVGADGKPNVADPACAERSRVMRLAGR